MESAVRSSRAAARALPVLASEARPASAAADPPPASAAVDPPPASAAGGLPPNVAAATPPSSVGRAELPTGTTGATANAPAPVDARRPRTVHPVSSRPLPAPLGGRSGPASGDREGDGARTLSGAAGAGGTAGGRAPPGGGSSDLHHGRRGGVAVVSAGRSLSLAAPASRRLSFRRPAPRSEEEKAAARRTRQASLSATVFRMPPIVPTPYGSADGASWSTDALGLFHNAAKKELSDLYVLVLSLQCRALDLGGPDWRALADWVATSAAFVGDLLAAEEELLFAWLTVKYKLDEQSPLAARAAVKAEIVAALDALSRLCATLPRVDADGGAAAAPAASTSRLRKRRTAPVAALDGAESPFGAAVSSSGGGGAAPADKAAPPPGARPSRFRTPPAARPGEVAAGLTALLAATDLYSTRLLAYLSAQERALLPVIRLVFSEADVRRLAQRSAKWAAGRLGATLPLLLRPLSAEAAEAWRRVHLGSAARRPVAAALAVSGVSVAARHGRA
ncbi:hypothetical protein BU14_2520s0001, partial [Porphyra umbilicalis]